MPEKVMSIELPTTSISSESQDPSKILIYSHPKIGKTSALIQLPNSLLIDLENGSKFVDGMKYNLVKKLEEENKSRKKEGLPELRKVDVLKLIIKAIRDSKHTYDYIIVDTISALEDIAKELALDMYKATPMGKGFTGTDVTTLAQGAGELHCPYLVNCWNILKLNIPQRTMKIAA